MIPGRGSQGACFLCGVIGSETPELLEDSCSQSGSSGSGSGSSRAGGRRRAGRQRCHFSQRENVELLPNVWWQAVARKSGSLGKSLHKDQ